MKGQPFKFFAVLSMVTLLSLTGCASMKTFNPRPPGCEQSIIYDNVPMPMAVSIIEIEALTKVVANNPSLKPYVVKFSGDMIVLLQKPNITYFDLGLLAVDQVKWANGYVGMIALSVSQILMGFDKQIPIYPCDRQFLVNHFNRQLAALGGSL